MLRTPCRSTSTIQARRNRSAIKKWNNEHQSLRILRNMSVYNRVAEKTQAYSEYKHSLTFHVRHYVVTATKPVHQLQICPMVHN